MSDLPELVVNWQRGWGVARSLPTADDLGDGLRVLCRQLGRDIEYVAVRADDDPPSVGRLAGRVVSEDAVTWLTVPTRDPDRTARALDAGGLVVLKRAERLMATDLREHPRHEPSGPYRLHTRTHAEMITVSVIHESGEPAAHGTIGLSGPDAVADRILTVPAHRRQGLASAVMSGLARAAVERGALRGILVASEEGQQLYRALGWQDVATVLIAATPGTTYPS